MAFRKNVNLLTVDNEHFKTSDNENVIVGISTGSFSIDFYNNVAEKNRVDKRLYLTFVTTVEGVLRENCSILSPVIKIELNELPTFNYVYISKFNRYYFVVDCVILYNNLYQLTLKCDVLMSHLDDIKNLTCIVARQEFIYNDNLVDNYIPVQKDVDVDFIEIPNEVFNVNTADENSHNYVLICVGA